MNNLTYYKEKFDQLKTAKDSSLEIIRQKAFKDFSTMGIPTTRHEEWKYTRISSLFNKEYQFPVNVAESFSAAQLEAVRLPDHKNANELVFLNGIFSLAHSKIISSDLVIEPLEEAAKNENATFVSNNFGHSGNYLKDGINALNTAFEQGAIFIKVKKGKIVEHPVYIYNITDARNGNILAQPRTLVQVEENAKVQFVETYYTIGNEECFTNQVIEIGVEKDAIVEYYKIQNDAAQNNQVSTTHIRQIGKCYVHIVTVSLNGGIVRNNLNVVMEASHSEAHLYGLYFQQGESHIDNHTVVDNVKPNCYSNEFYKGMMDDNSTGVFNGKIFVQRDAQKTNAYQSNRNVLLSDSASINSKPQLEIFADDVKCSHGCTVGKLDDEGLFYLQSRGISEKVAKSLLLHAFAIDILDQVKLEPIRDYIDVLISERLEYDIS